MKTSEKILCSFALLALLALTGCATTRDDREYSDMPWNTPAGWEGTVGVPGLTPQSEAA